MVAGLTYDVGVTTQYPEMIYDNRSGRNEEVLLR
jgi:hypothetical protein